MEADGVTCVLPATRDEALRRLDAFLPRAPAAPMRKTATPKVAQTSNEVCRRCRPTVKDYLLLRDIGVQLTRGIP